MSIVGYAHEAASTGARVKRVIRVDYSTLGVWRDDEGVGIGYRRVDAVEMPKACRLIVLIPDGWQPSQVKTLIDDLGDPRGALCVSRR